MNRALRNSFWLYNQNNFYSIRVFKNISGFQKGSDKFSILRSALSHCPVILERIAWYQYTLVYIVCILFLTMRTDNQIIIYTSPENHTEVTVKIEDDTVWLTQAQMAELFDTTPQNITLHMKNIYGDGELVEDATCKDFLQVRKEGKRNVERMQKFYNLDAIISVGYRVNSKRGTAFRIWATSRLKEYLVEGYSINQSRLDELGKTIRLLTEKWKNIDHDEAKWLLDIIASYTESFVLLNQYDSGSLGARGSEDITYIIDYADAKPAIDSLRATLLEKSEATPLFGNEKDTSFVGILSSVIATFDGIALYPTIEEQAAHLLYFIIKDPPLHWWEQAYRSIPLHLVPREESSPIPPGWWREDQWGRTHDSRTSHCSIWSEGERDDGQARCQPYQSITPYPYVTQAPPPRRRRCPRTRGDSRKRLLQNRETVTE